MRAKDHTGLLGEEIAADYLCRQGHTVKARRWRTRSGELDLVTIDGPDLVAVEVKTRRGTHYGHPLEAVTPQKLMRLHRLLHEYAAAEHSSSARRRVDIVGVLLPSTGACAVPGGIDHLKDVRI